MKKILVFLIIFTQMVLLLPAAQAQYIPGEKKKLLVTAYYSPLPDQRFYIRGSYEADRHLNGRGTNGADGTEVFIGMLAAPRTYSFGTRILIPGLGVGEVHDRGGAILAHADYDRIDVWMGKGEEGLARAINWGAQMVEGEVWLSPHQVEPGLSFSSVSAELSESLIVRLQQRTAWIVSDADAPVPAPLPPVLTPEEQARQLIIQKQEEHLRENQGLLAAGVGKNAMGHEVEALQRMLWELGYYPGPISRIYDRPTIEAVFLFQQDRGVLKTAYDNGAGYYGQKTHKILLAAIDERIHQVKEYPQELQTWIPAQFSLPKLEELSPTPEMPPAANLNFDMKFVQAAVYEFARNLGLNDQGEAVKALQKVLIGERHLNPGLTTGYYGYETRDAVTKFQLKNGLIASAHDPGAGRVGPRTREVLNGLLTK